MATTHTARSAGRKPLRLWPGVAAALLIVLFNAVSQVVPGVYLFGVPLGMVGVLVTAGGALVILLWWLFFSRARWSERLTAVVLIAISLVVVRPLLHPSIVGAGMGLLIYFFGTATMVVALVGWAVATRGRSDRVRLLSLIATIVLACGVWTLVRTGGIKGEGGSDFHWRWTPTPEEKLLAQTRDEVLPPPPSTPLVAEKSVAAPPGSAAQPEAAAMSAKGTDAPPALVDPVFRHPEWPGFRGPHRDGIARGVRIGTDWSQKPPAEIWRRPIGPGWSSFAVAGGLIYTQEQRGDAEVVSCYKLSTGEPVWRHRDPVRFYESNGGAGPRGTPTLHNGRVYSMGATGILNALDAATGAKLWSRQTAADADKKIPDWGIASSPLVVDGLVIVAVAGRLVAYDIESGKQQWIGEQGGGGYSSPHLATLDGVPQVLLVRGSRTIGVSPSDGKTLWEHNWLPAVSIVQPVVVGERDILIASHDGMSGNGMRRLEVKRGGSGWTVEERWTSRGLKPYFNDSVVHKGNAYGFDGSILSCIDLATGERKWKGGRYGNGQMLLLADQDVLLITAEEGDLALVKTSPDQYTELARIEAIKGKTWNHPVVVRGTLLVRNGEEMVAFRLPAVGQ